MSVLVFVVLAPLLFAPFPGPAAGNSIEEILRGAEESLVSAEELGKRLAGLGSGALTDLYATLVRGETLDGEPLTAHQEDALAWGLASFGRSVLLPFLQPRIEGASIAERGEILELLGRVGLRTDLGTLVLVAAPHPRSALDVRLGQVLREAVSALCSRDARAVVSMPRWILLSSPDLASALILAASDHPSEAVLTTFVDCLGFDRSLDCALLPQIGRVGEALDRLVTDSAARAVLPYLEQEDPQLLREAALACGRLETFEATSLLIALLDHEERGVREASQWALERSSGMRFGKDEIRWSAWLRSEQAWFEEVSGRLAPKLRQGEVQVALRTLGDVSQHRFERHRLATEVEFALEHENPLVRSLACVCLERLGSLSSRTPLTEALEDPDPSVAAAARRALQALGLDPPDPDPEEAPSLDLKIPERG